jgi:DNA polymerase I
VQRIEQTAMKGDTPEYVKKMQQEVFQVFAEARSLEELRGIEPKARQINRKYLDELGGADVRELAIHRR